ncbi:hypothetical protein Cni_G15896 [Canna indica]|uniref:Phytocyanin domain-containing protein n=1 Tax=Canna indica TaxID=4628 RepID=A0AAQ3KEG2_9LILI|nr:hypothetical protein Cni_G15896 [Canna indica]
MARLLVILCAILGLVLAGSTVTSATIFNVGDSAGWDISADLTSWVATKTFYVGDALLFQYSRYHSVDEVDKAGYDSCNVTAPLLTGSNGNTTVPLAAPGDRYFVCGTQLHCLGGMKLRVSVKVNQSSQLPAGGPPSPPQAAAGGPSPLPEWNSGTGDLPFLTNGAHRGGFVGWLCALLVVLWCGCLVQ